MLAAVAGCAPVPNGAATDASGPAIRREMLPHRDDPARKVELFWAAPAGSRALPAIVFIHGHQEPARVGGLTYVRTGRLALMARRGYVAAALSQPGYGQSGGPPDFCGPFTQAAALTALDFLRGQPDVDPARVVLYGYSRGAIVAGMVAAQDARLAGVILGAGAYDFASWYPTPMPGIDRNIAAEAGLSPEAFRLRSAALHVDRIRAPVLLLHGSHDERIPAQQAELFAARLQAAGRSVQLRIFPGVRHSIRIEDQYREVFPFLERVLR